MNKKKWVNSKIVVTITMVFVGCCFMSTSLWAQSYCPSSGDSYYFHTTLVKVADLERSSGDDGGYCDCTHLTAHLTQGKEYSVSVESSFIPGLPKGCKAWIDFNGDYDFDDEGEEVLSAYRSYTVPGCIQVPCCTIIGNTRMRIAVSSDSSLNFGPCGPIGYGEVEDYTVNITGNTVGNTTLFPSTSYSANRRAMLFIMPENGSICSVTMYHTGGTGSMILAVYSDYYVTPQNILAVTPTTAVSGTTGWQTICLPNPVWVAEGNRLWLAWVYEDNPGIRYQTGSPGRYQSDDTWSGGMPDPFGPGTQENYIYSIYATYRRCGCD